MDHSPSSTQKGSKLPQPPRSALEDLIASLPPLRKALILFLGKLPLLRMKFSVRYLKENIAAIFFPLSIRATCLGTYLIQYVAFILSIVTMCGIKLAFIMSPFKSISRYSMNVVLQEECIFLICLFWSPRKGELRIYRTFDPLPWLGLYKLLAKVLANRLKKKVVGKMVSKY